MAGDDLTLRILVDLFSFARHRLAAGEGRELLQSLDVADPVLCEAYGVGYVPTSFRGAMPSAYRDTLSDRRLRLGNSLLVPATDESGRIVDALVVRPGVNKFFRQSSQGLLGARIVALYPELIVVDTFPRLAHLWRAGYRNALLLRGLPDAINNASRLYDCGVRSVLLQTRRQSREIAQALRPAGISAQVLPAPKIVQGDDAELPDLSEWLSQSQTDPQELLSLLAQNAGSGQAPQESEPTTAVPGLTAIASPIFPSDPTTTTEAEASEIDAEANATTGLDESLPNGLSFASYDRKTEFATFRWREAEYVVEVTLQSESRLEVSIKHDGRIHRDRFDLAVEAQRRRFASSAALRTDVPAEEIEAHLIVILDEARRIKRELLNPIQTHIAPRVELSAERKSSALELLRDGNLMQRIHDDLESLGWVGEERGKLLLYLAAVSRKLPCPLWAALRASSGAGKSHGLDLIAALTPPEELMHVSRLTDSALYYQNPGSLRQKLLVIDEADALTPEVVVALRVLKTRGALSLSHVHRDPVTGQTRTSFMEVAGPISVLTSTAGRIDDQLISRCYEMAVDESPAQTARILEAQRRVVATPELQDRGQKRLGLIRLHQDAQRLLSGAPVLIPFAERIRFPSVQVRHRREQERFLALIEASALLHQYQRLRHDELIVADERDFELAVLLTEDVHGQEGGLSRKATILLRALARADVDEFTMEDLSRLRPEWTRHAFRSALRELMDLEYVGSVSGGRGRLRQYRLLCSEVVESYGKPRLVDVGALAELGDRKNANLSSSLVAG